MVRNKMKVGVLLEGERIVVEREKEEVGRK